MAVLKPLTLQYRIAGGGGGLHKIFNRRIQYTVKKTRPNQIKRFVKMRGQKDLIPMKKEIHWIKNQAENLYKMLKICQIIHVDKKLGQL